MAGEKIRLQRVHSESQCHLIMFRLTVHAQTTGSSYHIFLKVNVSVLTGRWPKKKKGIFTPSWKENKLVEIFQVMKYVSFPAHCFPRKPSQCLCLVQEDVFCSFLSTFKNQNPTNRISGCPGYLRPGRVAEDDLWPPLHSTGIQTWGTTPRPQCLLEQ